MKVIETKLGLMKKTAIKASGFTLIELLVTVLVAAILIGLAVPGLQELIRRNKMDGESQRLVGLLAQARNTAVSSGRPAFLCRTSQVLAEDSGNETFTCDAGEGLSWATDILVYGQLASNITAGPDESFANQIIETLEPNAAERRLMVATISEIPNADVVVNANRNDEVIRFNSDGTLANETPFRIGVCDTDADNPEEYGRIIEVSAGGQVRSSAINPGDDSRGCDPDEQV